MVQKIFRVKNLRASQKKKEDNNKMNKIRNKLNIINILIRICKIR